MNLGVSQLPFTAFIVTGALTLLGKYWSLPSENVGAHSGPENENSVHALYEVLLHPAPDGEQLEAPTRIYAQARAVRNAVHSGFTLVSLRSVVLDSRIRALTRLSRSIFGWTGNSPSTHWIGPTIGGALYFPGVFCAFQCILL